MENKTKYQFNNLDLAFKSEDFIEALIELRINGVDGGEYPEINIDSYDNGGDNIAYAIDIEGIEQSFLYESKEERDSDYINLLKATAIATNKYALNLLNNRK